MKFKNTKYFIFFLLFVNFGCSIVVRYYDAIEKDGGVQRQKMIKRNTKISNRKMKKLRKQNKGLLFKVNPK